MIKEADQPLWEFSRHDRSREAEKSIVSRFSYLYGIFRFVPLLTLFLPG